MFNWICALELDQDRQIIAGSEKALSDAVRRGADLRVGTTFRHNEHIDTDSTNTELVREVMDFRIVYLLKDYWVAGVQNLRMPVSLRKGFGPRESMSFFLYNQDGHQAIARPYLDGRVPTGETLFMPSMYTAFLFAISGKKYMRTMLMATHSMVQLKT